MTKSELKQLQQAVNVLDRESNRYQVYGEDVEIFEVAVEKLLAAMRSASIEVQEPTTVEIIEDLVT